MHAEHAKAAICIDVCEKMNASSLVLIHNVPEIDGFVTNMKQLADTIYL